MNNEMENIYLLGGFVLTAYLALAYALNKTAWEAFPFPNVSWEAERAVSGRYSDRSAVEGQCTISAFNHIRAEWQVDLRGERSIHNITIYYRTDNITWDETNGFTSHFLGFSVYVSNTTEKNEGTLCFKDTQYTTSTIPNMTSIECPLHGRYVIYYNERLSGVTYPGGYSTYAHNDLFELEVYGWPSIGYYGENCSVRCPKNCQGSYCYIVNGTCIGCVSGHVGPEYQYKFRSNIDSSTMYSFVLTVINILLNIFIFGRCEISHRITVQQGMLTLPQHLILALCIALSVFCMFLWTLNNVRFLRINHANCRSKKKRSALYQRAAHRKRRAQHRK